MRKANQFTALTVLALLCTLLALGARPAHAATFSVTKTADTDDQVCDADCSLREAIEDSFYTPEDDTINIGVTGTINLQSGLFVSQNVQIIGPGADRLRVRRDTGGDYPVFQAYGPWIDATISGLTIANGKGVGLSGGVHNWKSTNLTLKGVTVTNNTTDDNGGGNYNQGTLEIIDSTISGNTTPADYARGGGIYNADTLTVTNSTISGNAATGNLSGAGGIFNNGNSMTLTNVTVGGNSAPSGANLEGNALASIKSTIVANPQGGDNCSGGGLISQGHNLESGTSCSFTATGDLQNQDPKLGPLQNNGGPTESHALLAGSPAIDDADSSACPPTDQRAKKRDDGNNDGTRLCDIGAFERQVAPRVIKVTPSNLQKDVSPKANVYATFSESMNANTLRNATTSRSATFKLARRNADGTTTQVAAKVTYYAASNRAVLDPDNDLRLGTTYVATLTSGAKDLAGSALDQSPATTGNQPKVWRFTIRK